MNAKFVRGSLISLLARFFLAGWLVLHVACLSAANPDDGKDGVQVFVRQSTGNVYLAAKRVSMTQVLDILAKITGVTIHYPMPTENFTTVVCEGALAAVLDCLLGPGVDRVIRTERIASKKQTFPRLAEIWLLQTPMLGGVREESAVGDSNALGGGKVVGGMQEAGDHTQLLLEMVNDPLQRKDAIATLAVDGRKNDLEVLSVLRKALTDPDPGVRAQAVFALARLEGDDALADLQQAMRDENVDVRQMAVASVANNRHLLEQALSDSDAGIRDYAKTKLASLDQAGQD